MDEKARVIAREKLKEALGTPNLTPEDCDQLIDLGIKLDDLREDRGLNEPDPK